LVSCQNNKTFSENTNIQSERVIKETDSITETGNESVTVTQTEIQSVTHYEKYSEADVVAENKISDMNDWLQSQGYNPLTTNVLFSDCYYYCDPDIQINENRAAYVKGNYDTPNIEYIEPGFLTVINPDIEDGILTLTEGTINMLTTGTDSLRTENKITFISSDPQIVTIEGSIITAKIPGEVQITATLENGSTKKIKVVVNKIVYDAEAIKEALKKHSNKMTNYNITSELIDLTFDGIPELVEYTGGMASRFSQIIYVYRLEKDEFEPFFEIFFKP
jgi:hypothetical protein